MVNIWCELFCATGAVSSVTTHTQGRSQANQSQRLENDSDYLNLETARARSRCRRSLFFYLTWYEIARIVEQLKLKLLALDSRWLQGWDWSCSDHKTQTASCTEMQRRGKCVCTSKRDLWCVGYLLGEFQCHNFGFQLVCHHGNLFCGLNLHLYPLCFAPSCATNPRKAWMWSSLLVAFLLHDWSVVAKECGLLLGDVNMFWKKSTCSP